MQLSDKLFHIIMLIFFLQIIYDGAFSIYIEIRIKRTSPIPREDWFRYVLLPLKWSNASQTLYME